MSGLATFFHDYLPCDEIPDYSSNLFVKEEGSKEDEEEASLEVTLPLTLQEWRTMKKKSIQNYFHRRIGEEIDEEEYDSDHYGSEEDSTDSSSCETQDDDDDEALQTQLQTQQEPQPSPQLVDPSPTGRKKCRIPHIDHTLHQVSTLEYINLYTALLNVQVCHVTRVWRLRPTKRMMDGQPKQPCVIFPGRLPRIVYPYREEDGPLTPIYKQVVSLELTFDSNQKKKRMYMFLYNKYAQYFDKWYSSLKEKSQLLLRLHHIPAISILPFAIDPRNFVDAASLQNYCLCIGNDSSMKRLLMEESEPQTVRLDAPTTELRFLQIHSSTDETALELVLSPKTLAQESPIRQYGTLHRSSPAMASVVKAKTDAAAATTTATFVEAEEKNANNNQYKRARPVILPETLPPVGEMTIQGSAKKRKSLADKTSYITLSELKEVLELQQENKNLVFKLYAVVLGFTSGRITKRGDWMMTCTLVDDTCNEQPVTMVLFCEKQNELPQFTKMGNVLRMHRVCINEWKGGIQLLGRKMSSYVVIQKPMHQDFQLIPTAQTAFDFSPSDEARSQELWHWAQHFVQQHPTMKSQHSFTINDLKEQFSGEPDCDLTVMVTAKFVNTVESGGGTQPCGFLRIWDGTGFGSSDSLPIDSPQAKQSQRQGDPPPSCLIKVRDILRDYQKENMQIPKALCGKVVNVVIWEESYWKFCQEHVNVGSFLRMRNVHIRRTGTQQQLSIMVHDKSSITPLPDGVLEIRELLQNHAERMQRNEYNPDSGLLPLSSLLPLTNHQKGHGLREFTSNRQQESFVGLVCLGDVYPKYEGLLKAYCKASGDSFVYQFAISLLDESGKLDVIVSDTAGSKIIGMPASMAVGASRSFKHKDLVDRNETWMAKVLRCQVDQLEYFVLVDISKA